MSVAMLGVVIAVVNSLLARRKRDEGDEGTDAGDSAQTAAGDSALAAAEEFADADDEHHRAEG